MLQGSEARTHDLARTCSHTQRYIVHIVSICFYDIYLYMHVDCNEEKHLHTCRYDFILDIDIDLRKEWQKFQPPLVSLQWSHWICYQLPFSNTRLMICAYRPTGQIYRSLLPIQIYNQSQILATFTSSICPLFTSNGFQICGRNWCICKSESMIRLSFQVFGQIDVRSTPDVQCIYVTLISNRCPFHANWLMSVSVKRKLDDWHQIEKGCMNNTPWVELTEPERDDLKWDFLFYLGVPSSHFQFRVFTVTVCHVHLSGCEPRRSYVNLAQMRVLFQYVDANGDGSLSLTEFIEPLCQHCLASHS